MLQSKNVCSLLGAVRSREIPAASYEAKYHHANLQFF